MSLKFKQMRSASGYRPGKTAVEYEKLALHHAATVPVYETYERVIRELGPTLSGVKPNVRERRRWGLLREEYRTGSVRHVVQRTVTKIRYGADGKTPLRPLMQLVDMPGGDPAQPKKVHIPQSQLIPIAAPIRLKKGSPKAIYRLLKKLEQTVGLDTIYAQMAKDAA